MKSATLNLKLIDNPDLQFLTFTFAPIRHPIYLASSFGDLSVKFPLNHKNTLLYLDAILLINWKLFEMKSIFNKIGLKVRTGGTAALQNFPSNIGSAMAQK